MKQGTLFRSKTAILGVGIVLVIIGGVITKFYWTNNASQSTSVTTPRPPTATVEAVIAISPVSPISPATSPVGEAADPAEIEMLVQKGIKLYENQDYQGAVQVLNQVLNQDPDNVLAHNARGSVYLAQKDYETAIADYTKAIELDPIFPFAYYNRGRVYAFLKQYDQAISDLQYAIQLSPADFGYRAQGNIGLIYHQQGEYDKALEAFATAMSHDDSKADTYYHRGETYTAMANYEAAISDYEAAITRFPNYDLAYQSLGYARYKTGQFDQALAALDKALELSPHSPTPHFYRMLVYLTTNQVDKTKAEAAQGMETIGALPEEEQALLFKRILGDLESFAQENPAQVKDVEALVNLIPPQ